MNNTATIISCDGNTRTHMVIKQKFFFEKHHHLMSSGLKTPQSPRNGLSPLKPQTPSKQNKLVFYGCGQLNPNYDIQQKLGEGTFG